MAKRGLLALAFLIGCSNGVLGDGSGTAGSSGAAGGSGTGGTAGCALVPSFYCVSTCSTDVVTGQICTAGEWTCPAGTFRADTCKCLGYPPPGYVCGDSGWVIVDGGADGSAGAGGAADGGGGRGGSGGAAGGGGAAGQGGLGGLGDDTDGGADAATCTGTPPFLCLFSSCQNDVGLPAMCNQGVWMCPGGTVDTRGCNGCTGNPPPGWVCANGGWVRPDASSDGQGG